jgi:hypothetical protein
MGKTPSISGNVLRYARRLVLAPAILHGVMLLALAMMATTGAAHASANLVLNGTFAQDSLTPSGSGYSSFQLGTWQVNGSGTTYTGTVTNWTNQTGAYNYLMTTGTATALGQYGTLSLASGSSIGNAPGGGNFLANDGDYNSGTVSQTISGLTVGAPATLTFWWGAGVQNGFSLPNTENWTASLCPTSGCVGTDTQSTTPYTLTGVYFSGWMQATMSFIPTSTSEVLSFLAVGTGSPPFLLLSDVSVTTPEPGTLAVMLTGLVGLGMVARRRRRSAGQRAAATV